MDEAVAAAMTVVMSVMAIWMVDLAGTAGIGQGRAAVAAEQAADAVADAVAADPGFDLDDPSALETMVEQMTATATLGACDQRNERWSAELTLALDSGGGFAGAAVTVTCPLPTAAPYVDVVAATGVASPVTDR